MLKILAIMKSVVPRIFSYLAILALCAFSGISSAAPLPDIKTAKRIVILGDSITQAGDWVADFDGWLTAAGAPAEVLNLGLSSETASDLTDAEQQETHIKPYGFPRPAISERLGRILEKTKPDWVVECYGMNDGSSLPQNDEGFARFCSAMEAMKSQLEKAGVKQIIFLTPPIHDAGPGQPQDKHDGMLSRFSDWLISKRKNGWNVVDVHGPMRAALDEKRKVDPNFRFASDGTHPNREGHDLMAKQLIAFLTNTRHAEGFVDHSPLMATSLRELIRQRTELRGAAWLTFTGHKRPGIAPGLPLDEADAKADELTGQIQAQRAQPFPGKISKWNGYDRYDFLVGQKRTCSVIVPDNPMAGRLWAWKGEFLNAFPQTEIDLLKQGVYIVYLNVPNLLGAPEAVQHWNDAYGELISRYGMATKPALIGLSRGGLYCFNWAIANPSKVSCIYADAAVLDMKSWPGGKGKGQGSPGDWQLAFKVYGFKDEAEAMAFKGNPVDNLKPLADAKIPLIHVYGEADHTVPWEENTGIVAERYRALGGAIQLIGKPGVDHHPHGLKDPTPVLEFIVMNLKKANRIP